MSLVSSILNPVMFKDLSSNTLPNWRNTLHADRNHGTKKIINYCQKFDVDDVIVLQFCSTSATVPTLVSYQGDTIEIETIAGALARTVTGSEGTISYFNFVITLDSDYQNINVHFVATQGTDVLTSEPIWVYSMTEDIADGKIKKIHYSNYDRNTSDLNDRLIDWAYLPAEATDNCLYFYVEAIDFEPNAKDEQEIWEGSQSMDLVASTVYAGAILKTSYIPDYLFYRLLVCSALDFFAVNGTQYLRDGSVEKETFGNSTVFQCSLNLIEKTNLGFNVDNTDTEGEAMTQTIYIKNLSYTDKTTAFTVPIPANYDVHAVNIRHSSTSSGNDATVRLGTTLGGMDLIDSTNGQIDEMAKDFSFAQHAKITGTLYFDISGIGVKLDIKVQFIINNV